MAEYAIMLYASLDDAEGVLDPEAIAAHARYGQELRDAGVMVKACPLQPPSIATSIHGDVVTDGPFLETKEVLLGFCVIEAPDLDAALAIAGRNPICQQGGGVEVRPVAV